MRPWLLTLLAFWLVAAAPTMQAVRDLIAQGKQQEAFALAQAADAKNDADGAEALAWFYEQGVTVPADLAEAARLYRKAAEAGNKHSQWRLGVFLDTGRGAAANPAEAFQWLQRSAAQNYGRAHVSLGVLYATGRGVERNYGKAKQHYRLGAELVEPHGFYGLGVLYANGEGVEKDEELALAFMVNAAGGGDAQAKAYLDQHIGALSPGGAKRVEAKANEILREFYEIWNRRAAATR